MKKVFLLLAGLLFPVLLFSASWSWSSSYINVTNFRYQLDNELEDEWKIVPSNVTSLTVDGGENSVLFVQQSLDYGRSWSPSGIAKYVADNKIMIEEVKIEEAEKAEEVSVPSKEEELSIPEKLPFAFFISPLYERAFNLGSPALDNGLGLELGFSFRNNGFGLVHMVCFNLDLGLVLYPYPPFTSSWFSSPFSTDMSLSRYYFDILLVNSIGFKSFDISFGFGLGTSLLNEKDMGMMNIKDHSLVPSLLASLSFDCNLSSHMALILEAKYHYDLVSSSRGLVGLFKIGVLF